MRLAWPLTGRLEETRLIDAALASAALSGIVIYGAAGVGKSRIAREALSTVAADGHETRWAVGTSAARALPLGTFARWVGTSDADSVALAGRVIDGLTAASNGQAVLVCVDDAHLLDGLSGFVLQQIVQRRAAKLLLTVRTGAAVPAEVLAAYDRGVFERLDLQPLSRDESARLLTAALGGPLDPDAAQRLWRLTRGNVLYLRNIVEQEVTQGRLAFRRGYWRWTGDPVMPPGLVELIEARIGALPPAVSQVIDVLAVAEPIQLDPLTAITDADSVAAAETRGLITIDSTDSEVRVAHPLYAEVRRNRVPGSRLRRLRGLVASALADRDECDSMRVVVRRASLMLDSDLPLDPELLTRAAQGAVWLSDLMLADRLASAAMSAGAGPEANFIRAHALSWLSRGEEAEAVLDAIEGGDLTDDGRARLSFLWACNRLWALADPVGAKRHIDDAATRTPAAARTGIDAFYAVYWAAMGDPARALAASDGLDLDALPAIVGAVTGWAVTTSRGDAGRVGAAVTAAQHGYRIADRFFDAAQTRFVIADAHIGALLLAGHIRQAREEAEQLGRQAAELSGAAQLFGAALAGRAALGACQLDTAAELLDPVVEMMRAAGENNGFGYRFCLPRVTALAMRGLADDANVAELDECRHPSWRYLGYEHALVHAWVAATQGAVSQAVDIVLDAADTAGASGQLAAEVLCLQTAAQFGDHSRIHRLDELTGLVEGPRVGAAAALCRALAHDNGDGLSKASTEFEELGDVIAAADAAALAAVAYRRRDMRGSAMVMAARAKALGEACGGATTPALLAAVERLPLTDREREIAMLIGAGLSSRAIAERLHLSVRTVEGHIYRAMAKTGVSTRAELIALLPRRHR
ncbi:MULTISPECIES: LuxR family transcriptional regulator [unclassified Mycolicibacterium]|uniref:helix-turn-helix transcriptional regulator n=1 Tax=unclassified Mycolicibacterium TaxID=2636767 RepID=UPI00130B00DF|nr:MULTISPECIES: LuxR family transcriptional regulator [unclassified Mycolicibacterium]MUL84427.1 helix-turn-helix transcriptional regulator [Mycolicibacterium sp. CBMA 329]MUL88202.1 helix-turn-helix transcriptional regulator [Mycolicibacterium sp. CBMA 331]MUL99349.1 helix-turn-helix transcriptional regulator [Mycolicibacterium sp. CBMA 334]MUM27977.1 helix-turn-helix transcriptional regulator [Mycolicibacterium sp. CBMA 295]MUM39849.1 helix-turn-helix transcriptional regulator [Mycolicibact